MASFGWSAGDIVATLLLVNRVITCISGAHNARDHFQELLSELRGLSTALDEISKLTQVPGQTPEIQALKFAACSCRETLQRFYEKIRPFEDSLGVASRQSKVKAVPRMVRWELLIKKDVPELRTYLVAHVGSLNLRLSTALLKMSSTSQLQGRRIDQKQDMHTNLLQLLTKEQAKMAEKIRCIPIADTIPKLDSLLTIAIGVWKSQNEILSQLAKASHQLPPPDLDHTWAQAPVKLEDALGRRFVIPSEYDWDKVEAVIQAQFKKGPGCLKVQSGDYELFDRRTGHSMSESNFFGLIPGSYIIMTIILGRYHGGGLVPEGCTRFGCRSSRVKRVNPETMTCMECQSTFRKASKTLPRPMKPIISDPIANSHKISKADNATRMDLRYYKNVSTYFVELPSTPGKFREKYTRDYPLPLPQTGKHLPEQGLLQSADKFPALSWKPSLRTGVLPAKHGVEASDSQMTRQRNSSGIRSMLHRQISSKPLARLNFHTSAKERYSNRPSKEWLNNPGNEAVLPQVTAPQISQNKIPKQNTPKWYKGQLIGKGIYSRVYLATNSTTGEFFAVKEVEVSAKVVGNDKDKIREMVAAVDMNIDCIRHLDHVNIVRYLGCERKEVSINIFLEYMSGGSVGECLRKHGKFEEAVVSSLTRQILAGLEYLHREGVLHRNLKAENILLHPDGTCKISDFGVSMNTNEIYGNNTSLRGSIFRMAPEIVHPQGQGFSAKVDIWSLGCVVLEMLAGESPWSREETTEAVYEPGSLNEAPPIPDDVAMDISHVSLAFLLDCFTITPTERPTAHILLSQHPFCDFDPNYRFLDTDLYAKMRGAN